MVEENQFADSPLPPAFLFFTNHPYHYVGNNTPEPGKTTIFTAINMPEFKKPNDGEVAAIQFPEVFELFDSVVTLTGVPSFKL